MSERTDLKSSVSSVSPSRRSILRAIGVAGGVSMLGGAASAKPGNGRNGPPQEGGSNSADPKAACGECIDGTYEKFDGAPKVGDEYSLGGGTVTITDVMKKDDGEVYAFKYETDAEISKVCVKGGRPTLSYTSGPEYDVEELQFTGNGSGQWFYAPENTSSPHEGDYYQVSNVAYCNSPGTYYQIDLVIGEPIQQFDPPSCVTYSAQGRRVTSIVVGSNGMVNPEPSGYTGNIAQCDAVPQNCVTTSEDVGPDYLSAFRFDAEAMRVKACWESACPGEKVTLAAYRLPAGQTSFDPATASQQVLVAHHTVPAGEYTDGGCMYVDIDDGTGGVVN